MLKRPRIIAVDFDGTLCGNMYPSIGGPNEALIAWLRAEREHGTRIILWTCRTGELLTKAIDWSRRRGLEFDAVNDNLPWMVARFHGENPRKIYADIYIDDHSYGIKDIFEQPYISTTIEEESDNG